jgi:hypothetical protein
MDHRYPYTYSCDLIREYAGHDKTGCTKLSRSDASAIRSGIATALGIDDEDLARALANYSLTINRNTMESK